jgi:F-type H+-transporting ATPase subunit epsilon
VLPGHSPLISTIRPGMIEIYETRPTISERVFVVSGIAEVTPERCTVLAEEAMAPSALNRAEAEAELQAVEGNLPSLREQVGRATGADRDRLAGELRQLEQQQAIARAKLQALTADTAH